MNEKLHEVSGAHVEWTGAFLRGGLGEPGPPHQKYFAYLTVVLDCYSKSKIIKFIVVITGD